MKVLLTLVLAVSWLTLVAQPSPAFSVYRRAELNYQVSYPASWRFVENEEKTAAVFYAGATAIGTISVSAGSNTPNQPPGALQSGPLDSLWSDLLRLPRLQVVRLEQRQASDAQELEYHYSFASGAGRTRVVGRRVWRARLTYRLEYRASTAHDTCCLGAWEQLLASFSATTPAPRRAAPAQQCDDKLYGIAALRYVNEAWEDDCRTIHEFSTPDLTAPPTVHRQALPFQSYALAKGFDNCLYSVTKAPTNSPEYVYRYNPSTRRGAYTTWQLPAQGVENVWISATTDAQGDLYFMTADGARLVKIAVQDSTVTTLWSTDPMRQAPFYPAIGFAGAGSHGNFCLDEQGTLYEVYSTDGSLLRASLSTGQPAPERIHIRGLPARGGYSDVLLQNDPRGRRRLYMAGPQALYQVDLARNEAFRVRRGIYTDLAGCNLFRAERPGPPTSAAAPATGTWRGRVLDALTFEPLPGAQLRLGPAGAETTVALTKEQARFSFLVEPGHAVVARVHLPGYLPLERTIPALAGPYVQDLLVQPLKPGATQPLDNVQFEQGSARLLPSSFPALKQLVILLQETPGLTIELRGHTDNVGVPAKNVVLSQQRVAAVKAYLVRRGVAATRITGQGLGGAEPRASNAQEATRKLNRRVEFRVTGGR